MVMIEYKNDLGRVRFGGGSDKSRWKLIQAEGLGLSGKSFNVAAYPGQAGQVTLSEKTEARTITLKGDVRFDKDRPAHFEISNALRVLNVPGVLTVSNGIRTRKIGARCMSFEQGDRHGPYQVFIAQFICDNPYFEEVRESSAAVMYRTPLIKKTFSFPTAFAIRRTRSVVYNAGDAAAEPIITIECTSEGENEEIGLDIINHTTGQSIELEYNPAAGEQVVINIPERSIYNNSGENLIETISDDSFLDDFVLAVGGNDLEVINRCEAAVRVSCGYLNRYAEAVI